MDSSRPGCTITEIAKACGLTVRSLRYYEQVGLLNPSRTSGNARIYTGRTIRRVRAIATLRSAGVDLGDIVDAYQAEEPGLVCLRLSQVIEERLLMIERQARDLRALAADLAPVHDPSRVQPVAKTI